MDPSDLLSDSDKLVQEAKKLFKTNPSNQQKIQEQKDHALTSIQSDSKPLKTNFRPPSLTEHSLGHVFGFKVLDKNDVLAFIERFYLTHHQLPHKPDFLSSNLQNLPTSHQGWQDLLLELEPGLIARGIPHYDTPLEFLEPNFVLAVNLITNPYDKRPVASKLKDANLTTKQWKNLLLKPAYLEFYQSNLDKIFDEQTKLDAKLGLQKLIANGDLNAIKHYQELQNIYRPQTNYNDMLMRVVQAIIEILVVHVTPETLSTISKEIGQVINTSETVQDGPVGLPLGA